MYTLVFRLPAGRSPPVPNRDALCATKHLARASSCLYVAAHSLSPSLPLSPFLPRHFSHSGLSLPRAPPSPPLGRWSCFARAHVRSLSPHPIPPPTHVHASRYPVDILRTSAFSIRVPNKIFISDISNSVNHAWSY